jgi:hypothetical protein
VTSSESDPLARPATPALADASRPLFGYGLALDDGDLVLEDGRLRLVAGTANLVQALTLRVLTPFGSDRFDVTYGLDVRRTFTEPHGRRTTRELLRLDLVRTLGTDPRVAEIRDVIFADDADPGLRIASAEVVVETVAGTTATLVADPRQASS